MKKRWVAVAMAVSMMAAQSMMVFGASITTSGTVVVPTTPAANNGNNASTESTEVEYRPNEQVPQEVLAQGPGAVLKYTHGTGGFVYQMNETFHEDNKFTEAQVQQITDINAGKQSVSTLPSDTDNTGYEALIRIQEVHKVNAVNNKEIRDQSKKELSLYVPNLIEGLKDVSIMWFNSKTGKWEILPPTAIDYKNKVVTVNLQDLGPLTVVYKK